MKTKETIDLENAIYSATVKMGVFGCHEVTIGWYGKERVDFMTYDTKGIFRCYEIKVSLSDFNSKAKHTFCGHFNYFVLTRELYDKVCLRIPDGIGVYVGSQCLRRAKKREPMVAVELLKDYLIRCLAREAQEKRHLQDPELLKRYDQTERHLQRDLRAANDRVNDVMYFISEDPSRRQEYRDWKKKREDREE